jgi:hypothetical protein
MPENDGAENKQGQRNLPKMYYQTWRWRTDYQKIFGKLDRQFEQRVQRALDYLEQRKAVTRHKALTLVRNEEENSTPSGPAPLSEVALSNWHVDYRTVFGNLDGQFDKRLEQARLLLSRGQALSRYEALLRVREAEESSSSPLDQAGSRLNASPPIRREEEGKQIPVSPPPADQSQDSLPALAKLTMPNERALRRWRSAYRKLFGQVDERFDQRMQQARAVMDQGRMISKFEALSAVRQMEEGAATKPLSMPDADSSRPSQKALSAMGYRQWRKFYIEVFGSIDMRFNRRLEQARLLLDQGQASGALQALWQIRWIEKGATSRPSQDEAVQVPGTEADRINRLEAEVTRLEQDIRALYIWKHWAAARLTNLADMYGSVRKPIRNEPPVSGTDQTCLLLVEIRDTLRRLERAVEAAVQRF